jgi:hypothetical protein
MGSPSSASFLAASDYTPIDADLIPFFEAMRSYQTPPLRKQGTLQTLPLSAPTPSTVDHSLIASDQASQLKSAQIPGSTTKPVSNKRKRREELITRWYSHPFGQGLDKEVYSIDDLCNKIDYFTYLTKCWYRTLPEFCSEVTLNEEYRPILLNNILKTERTSRVSLTAELVNPGRRGTRRIPFGDAYKRLLDSIIPAGTGTKEQLQKAYVEWARRLGYPSKVNGSKQSKFKRMFALFEEFDWTEELLRASLLNSAESTTWLIESCKLYLTLCRSCAVSAGVNDIKRLLTKNHGLRRQELADAEANEGFTPGVTQPRVNAGHFNPQEHGNFFFWGSLNFLHILASTKRRPGYQIPSKVVDYLTAGVISLFTHLRVIRQVAVQRMTVSFMTYALLKSVPRDHPKPYFVLSLFDTKRKRKFGRAFPISFARIVTHYIEHIRPTTRSDVTNLFVRSNGSKIENYSDFTKTYYKGSDAYVRHSMKRKGAVTALKTGRLSQMSDISLTAEHTQRTAEMHYESDLEIHAAQRLLAELEGELRLFDHRIPIWWVALYYPVLLELRQQERRM